MITCFFGCGQQVHPADGVHIGVVFPVDLLPIATVHPYRPQCKHLSQDRQSKHAGRTRKALRCNRYFGCRFQAPDTAPLYVAARRLYAVSCRHVTRNQVRHTARWTTRSSRSSHTRDCCCCFCCGHEHSFFEEMKSTYEKKLLLVLSL